MSRTGGWQPLFISLAKTIADEPHLPSRRAYHSVGGPGMFSTLGARLAVRKDQKHKIAYVLLAESDNFAKCGERQLAEWDISFEIFSGEDRETATGHPWSHAPESAYIVTYKNDCPVYTSADGADSDHKWVGPVEELQPYPHHLPNFFLESKSFYWYGSPEQVARQEGELFYLRRKHGIKGRPFSLWEPSPEVCNPLGLKACLAISEIPDVFSPSSDDLLALFGHDRNTPFDRSLIEHCTDAFLEEDLTVAVNSKDIQFCIVRAGQHGTLLGQQFRDGRVTKTWIPAFYSADDQDQIYDARGSGSTFLGAFAVEYLQTGGDAIQAAIKASVCASFAVEQDGLPNHNRGITREAWNGATVAQRILEYHSKHTVHEAPVKASELSRLPMGPQGTG